MATKRIPLKPKVKKQLLEICSRLSQSDDAWASKMALNMRKNITQYTGMTWKQIQLLTKTAREHDVKLTPEVIALEKRVVAQNRPLGEQMYDSLRELRKIAKLLSERLPAP